jgi:hypothetical protein
MREASAIARNEWRQRRDLFRRSTWDAMEQAMECRFYLWLQSKAARRCSLRELAMVAAIMMVMTPVVVVMMIMVE